MMRSASTATLPLLLLGVLSHTGTPAGAQQAHGRLENVAQSKPALADSDGFFPNWHGAGTESHCGRGAAISDAGTLHL